MPGLIFPIVPDGLLTPVLLGPDRAQMQALQSAGAPLPAPLHIRALIDTGSDHTAIAPSTLTVLGLSAGKTVQTRTAGGLVSVQLYSVSLTLFDPAVPSAATLYRPSWTVTNLGHDSPDADMLIGMDLISELILIVDGPGRRFTLSF